MFFDFKDTMPVKFLTVAQDVDYIELLDSDDMENVCLPHLLKIVTYVEDLLENNLGDDLPLHISSDVDHFVNSKSTGSRKGLAG